MIGWISCHRSPYPACPFWQEIASSDIPWTRNNSITSFSMLSYFSVRRFYWSRIRYLGRTFQNSCRRKPWLLAKQPAHNICLHCKVPYGRYFVWQETPRSSSSWVIPRSQARRQTEPTVQVQYRYPYLGCHKSHYRAPMTALFPISWDQKSKTHTSYSNSACIVYVVHV